MARELSAENSEEGKLAVLRAFFFWLKHKTMSGARVPWMKEGADGTDCVVIDGPDVLVLGEFRDLGDAPEAAPGDPGATVEQEEAPSCSRQGSTVVKLEPV